MCVNKWHWSQFATERGTDIVQLHRGCNQYGVPAWRLEVSRQKLISLKIIE